MQISISTCLPDERGAFVDFWGTSEGLLSQSWIARWTLLEGCAAHIHEGPHCCYLPSVMPCRILGFVDRLRLITACKSACLINSESFHHRTSSRNSLEQQSAQVLVLYMCPHPRAKTQSRFIIVRRVGTHLSSNRHRYSCYICVHIHGRKLRVVSSSYVE